MTKTQSILHNFLMISLGSLMVTTIGCGKKQADGQYCLGVEEDAECPSVDAVNDADMPYEPECSTIKYLEVTELSSQSDAPYLGYYGRDFGDTGDDEDGDTCCYTAIYREKLGAPDCVVGRPFVREEKNLVAELKEADHSSWKEGTQIDDVIEYGTAVEREFAGEFYLQVARYEHASVASFNRFALELIQFGAPPELLRLAQKAATDEIRHAQSSFSIANRLLKTKLQPGTLDINVEFHTNFRDFAAAILEEGAIQETIASLIAAEQLRVCKDAAISKYLQEVVLEEAEHAELAYASLRWCIEIGGEEIKDLIRERLEQEFVFSFSQFPVEAIEVLGLPSQDMVQATIDRGLRRVIIPSLRSLLE